MYTKFNSQLHVTRKTLLRLATSTNRRASVIERDQNVKEDSDPQHDLHLRKDEKARSYFNEGALKCVTDDTSSVHTFDLQKALPFTILSFSEASYKRNMYV